MFDDLTFGDFEHFIEVLGSPHNVFFELEEGAGLVSFTEVQPRVNASMHFIFYDKKLKGKEHTMWNIMRDMGKMCALRRITCAIPEDRETGIKLVRRLGFRREGCLRKAFLRNSTYLDIEMFGLLAEELPKGEMV